MPARVAKASSGGRFRKVPEGSGVCWCGFRRQVPVPEAGSGRFRKVPEGSGVCWWRFRVPEGSGGLQCVVVEVPEAGSGRLRRVPECAGVGSGCNFRKVPAGSGVCWWCRFRRQVPDGSKGFRCVLV